MINPGQFLEAVAAYQQSRETKSTNRIARLGVVDPAYVSGKPKVTFDGDAVMSSNGLAYLSSYVPDGGDRVVLLPVGNTYLILGSVIGS